MDESSAERLARIETNVAQIRSMMERHEKMMYGNGSAGCVGRLQKLEDTAETNRTNIKLLFHKLGAVHMSIWMASGGVAVLVFMIANGQFFGRVLGLK